MLDSIQTHGERLLRHPSSLAAVALGTAALGADFFFGIRESHSRRSAPEFYVTRRENALGTIAVARGCQSDGGNYTRQIRQHAPEFTIVGSDYGKHGRIGGEEFCEGLGASLKDARAEKPSFVCQSMGGIAIMREFVEYADQSGLAEDLGGFGNIVLDSSPFDHHDIRWQFRGLLIGARLGRHNWSLDHSKLKICQTRHLSGADAHLDTIFSEGRYMKSFGEARPLPAIMDNVIYINSPYDNVINSDQAAAKYEAITPAGRFVHIVDSGRKVASHAAKGVELDTLIELATTDDIAAVLEERLELEAIDPEKWAKMEVLRAPTSLVA